jgi:NADH-quinone oxidoreductase subunit E
MPQAIERSRLKPIFKKYEGQDGVLIPVLQETQAVFGYLPEEALQEISRHFLIPLSRIYGVITFYAQFYLSPRGRHLIKSCQGTACHVRGAKGILEALYRNLHIDSGETTKDQQFSLETVACVGTCFLAPVVMIDEDYYGKLTPKRIEEILKKYKRKQPKEEAQE